MVRCRRRHSARCSTGCKKCSQSSATQANLRWSRRHKSADARPGEDQNRLTHRIPDTPVLRVIRQADRPWRGSALCSLCTLRDAAAFSACGNWISSRSRRRRKTSTTHGLGNLPLCVLCALCVMRLRSLRAVLDLTQRSRRQPKDIDPPTVLATSPSVFSARSA